MVAQTSSPPRFAGREIPIRARSGVSRLVLSLTRLASIQTRLVLAQVKLTAQRLTLALAGFTIAAVFGILGIIFLYIGVFKVLTRYVLDAPWVWLIYGGIHAVLAVALAAWAMHTLRRPLMDPENEEPAAAEKEPT